MDNFYVISLIKTGIVAFVFLTLLAYLQWIERKVLAHIQLRPGPYRVGPHGLLQPLADVIKLLTKECFQTSAQAEEKYNRATLSQVQLCSYYTGATAIKALREEYKNKLGSSYTLKNFHEKFLSFGSSPVKYIRERMLD